MKGTPKQVGYPYNTEGQRTVQNPQTQVGETSSQTADTLEYANHPKYQLIQQWIGDSEENRQWFEKNKTTLFSDPESINIAGFALALNPLEALHTFKGGLEQLKKTNHKKYPCWRSIVCNIPGNLANQSKFIQEVLGLTLRGYIDPKGIQYFEGVYGFAWSYYSLNELYSGIEFSENECNFFNYSDSDFSYIVLGCK